MSEKTVVTTRALLTAAGKAHQALLTTFRRSGEGVSTQVGTVAANGKLYFMTAANTWKVKRMASNPRVLLAPCNGRGQARGPAVEGRVRRLAGDEVTQARAWLRVGVLGHFWGFIFDRRNPGDKTAVYEIALVVEDDLLESVQEALAEK
jgi:PPOX class probable F420-dependent enzyme